MRNYGWDKGLDFDQVREEFKKQIIANRKEGNQLICKKRLTHYAILITQLANGSRISEAYEAVATWAEGKSPREIEVRVRKRGNMLRCNYCGAQYSKRVKKGGLSKHQQDTGHKGSTEVPSTEVRLIVIPPELQGNDLLPMREAIARGLSVKAVKEFVRRNQGFNSHALRYAQITQLAEKGYTPQVIAKITHHKSLDFILKYTQQKAADEALRGLVSEGKED